MHHASFFSEATLIEIGVNLLDLHILYNKVKFFMIKILKLIDND